MRNSLRPLLFNPILRLCPILVLALILRLWDLDARSIWFDEAVEFWAAKPALEQITRSGAGYLQPPLFSYVLHLWLEIGSSVFWMRLLSLLFSLGSTAGLMLWAYRRFGLRGAAITGLLFALLPAEIRYAQDISEYALLVFGIVWSLVFLDFAMNKSTWRNWVLWGIFSVIAVYSHFGGAIPIASTSIIAILNHLRKKDWPSLKKQSAVAAAALLSGIPLFIILFLQQWERWRGYDVLGFSFQLSQLLDWFTALEESFLFLTTGWPYTSLPLWLGRGFLFFTGILLIVAIWKNPTKNLRQIILWLLVTFTSYFILSELGYYAHGTFGFRYVLILAPMLIMLIATIVEGVMRSPMRLLAYVFITSFVGLLAFSLPNRTISELTRGESSPWPETEDHREIFNYWLQSKSEGEATYVYYGASPSFRYYIDTAGLDTSEIQPGWLHACWIDRDIEVCVNEGTHYGAWIRDLPPGDKLISIENLLGGLPAKVWIIFGHTILEEEQTILEELGAEYDIGQSLVRVHAAAYLLVRR